MDIQHTLNHYGLPAIGAALALFAAGWSRVKAAFQYVSGFLVLQKKLDYALGTTTVRHLRLHYKRMKTGVSNFRSQLAQVDDLAISTNVPFDMPPETSFWWGKRGFFVLHHGGGGEVHITCIRWMADPYALVQDAVHERMEVSASQNQFDRNFYVRRVMGTAGESMGAAMENQLSRRRPVASDSAAGQETASPDQSLTDPILGVDESWVFAKERYIQNRKRHDPLRGLFFPPDVHEVLEAAKTWFRSRQWYQDHGVPWRTGFMFHGPGGTGKSSLARVTAQTLGLPLYQYFLNTLSDREFVDAWEDMNTPCVVALEDFDTVFHGRESVTVHKSLSFECVLNQISGISSINGVLLVVTTNHLEHIDPAMGQMDDEGRPTRPGRIDRILHMGATTEQQRHDIAHHILEEVTPDVQEMVVSEVGATAAQFQSRCIQLALERRAVGK